MTPPNLAIPDGRPLGVGERLFFHVDRASPTNAVLASTVEGPLTEDVLRRALDAAQARHPLTRARLSWRGTPSLVLDAPAIPLRVVEAPEDGWSALAERELAEPLPVDTGPFSRVVLVRHGPESSTVVLNLHHGISDARSLLIFMRDLLHAAGRLTRGESPALPPRPLRPPIEALLPPWTQGVEGLGRAARALAGEALGMLKSGMPKPLPPEADSPLEQRRTRVLSRSLTAEASERVVLAARARGTTVQGILSAALFLSARDELAPAGTTSLTNFFPVDLRKRLDPPLGEDDVGLFISGLRTVHHVGPGTDPWAFAREVRGTLDERFARKEPFVLPFAVSRMLGAVTRPLPEGAWGSRQVARLYEAIPLCTTGVTNLGVVDLPERSGALTLRSTYLAASLFTMGQFVTCALTLSGRLHLSFLYLEPVVSRARAERLAAGFVRHLERAVELALDAP